MKFYRWQIVLALLLIIMLGLQEVLLMAETEGQLIQKLGQRSHNPSAQTSPPDVTRDYANLKIVPHPSGGMYIGQYEWVEEDIETFEAASGRKTALLSRHR